MLAGIPRSQHLQITGTGGGPNDVAIIFGGSISGSVPDGLVGEFICSANAGDGQFTVPADVMANIPPTDLPLTAPSAALAVRSFSSAKFTATGLDLGYVWSVVTTGLFVVFQ